MTVVEQDGRIVVVDVGLRFPTPEMVGIDLVLPDFSYLRERARDIEAIIVTHGHEDHLGALPWVLRELGDQHTPPVYGGALTMAMARSKLDEHKLRDISLNEVEPADTLECRCLFNAAPPVANISAFFRRTKYRQCVTGSAGPCPCLAGAC